MRKQSSSQRTVFEPARQRSADSHVRKLEESGPGGQGCLRFMAVVALAMAMSSLLTSTAHAAEDSPNRVSVSARFGVNMSAKFKGLDTLPAASITRTTPNGDAYNYDNGYVLTDISGNAGGETWYWGYDDSASQVVGDTIELSRPTVIGGAPEGSMDCEASPGVELLFSRELGRGERFRVGVELGLNYMNLDLSGSRSFVGDGSRTTDAYPFRPGTTPPGATPASPYQGGRSSPGFLIGDTPVSSTTEVVPGTSVAGQYEFEADLWGMRAGPYVELPVGDRFSVTLSGGLALAVVSADASWSETISQPGGGGSSASGGGSDHGLVWGGYVAGAAEWRFSERWSAVGGVEYQLVEDYEHRFSGREAELELGGSVFLTVGVGFRF